MKKDRNTFFEGSSMNMAYNTNMPTMMPQMAPINTTASASQSFYSNMNNPMMMPMMAPNMNQFQNDSTINELESRMAKLERQLNRLENRLLHNRKLRKFIKWNVYGLNAYFTKSKFFYNFSHIRFSKYFL